MKTIILTCESCGAQYEKYRSEHNRCQKRGRGSFCSRSCAGRYGIAARRLRGEKIGTSIHLVAGSTSDQFSPFRYYLKSVRARHKQHGFSETDLTLEILKQIWENQKGTCPLTGWEMSMPPNLTVWANYKLTKETASLDRIQPKQPYTKDNVRFVCHMANMAKHIYTDEEVIAFCKAVSKKFS